MDGVIRSTFKLVVIVVLLAFDVDCFGQQEQQSTIGRIKSFDAMLLMYGKEITEGKNLKPAIEEAKRLSNDPSVIKEHADYYVEILEEIEESHKPSVINMERDRLNGIITSASYQPDGQVEINYAIMRRNILESFVDSSAQYLMDLVLKSPDLAMSHLKELVNKQAIVGADSDVGDVGGDDDDDDDDDGGRVTRIADDL